MVTDVDLVPQHCEIEDLWPAFCGDHPALQIPCPFTRQAYTALAPTLGPWLMATQGLSAEIAQLALESIWRVLTGRGETPARYRYFALEEVFQTTCTRWATSFDTAVGYGGILFAYPDILTALQLDDDDQAVILAESADVRDAMARVTLWNVTDTDGGHHVAVSLADVVDKLSPLSTLPACQWLWYWIRTTYAPAIARQGYYDPAHGPVPVGQELDALECRENARALLNGILPGLGDDTLAAGPQATFMDC